MHNLIGRVAFYYSLILGLALLILISGLYGYTQVIKSASTPAQVLGVSSTATPTPQP